AKIPPQDPKPYPNCGSWARRLEDLETTEREVSDLKVSLVRTSEETAALRQKVTLQLDIIHRILCDPSEALRIEEHSNPFAPGNFANLRRVAAILDGGETKGTGPG
ncbi:MAG: hypothetical protein NTU83_09230, partial [Candidatus Hydrogenedentes bacterium]|nr:hypothetical protein [Candidatus Hydrogenedentota bacterium]